MQKTVEEMEKFIVLAENVFVMVVVEEAEKEFVVMVVKEEEKESILLRKLRRNSPYQHLHSRILQPSFDPLPVFLQLEDLHGGQWQTRI